MSIICQLPSQRKLAATPAVLESLGFSEPIFKKEDKLYANYAASVARFNELGQGLKTVLKRYYEKDFTPPTLPEFRSGNREFSDLFNDMHHELYEGSQALIKGAEAAGLGMIEWHDESSCVFDYPEVRVTKGWTKNTITRLNHTHDLVGARQHKLPCDVKRPAFVDHIVSDLPAFVRPHLRIVTGLEVVKSTAQVGTEERLTSFGQFIEDAKVKNAAILAAALAAGFATGVVLSDLAQAAATAAAAVAIADPCLCLGSLVLAGWENE